MNLQTVAVLVCEIDADFTLGLSTVESRWTVPDGRMIQHGEPLDRYSVIDGYGGSRAIQYESILLVQNLVFTDANIYTCEVRDIRDSSSPGPWVTAQVHLHLRGND